MQKLLPLPSNATKEELIVALNEADNLLLDNIFFKKLAKRLGKSDAKRVEQDINADYVIDLFDTQPAKVILHYNLRVQNRTVWQKIGQFGLDELKEHQDVILKFIFSRLSELTAHGMTLEHAQEVISAEINDTDNDNEDIA